MNESHPEDEDERRLRRAYGELRAIERDRAPRFASFWNRAKHRARERRRPRRWAYGAGVLATAAALVLTVNGLRNAEPLHYAPTARSPIAGALHVGAIEDLQLPKPEPLAFLREHRLISTTPHPLLRFDGKLGRDRTLELDRTLGLDRTLELEQQRSGFPAGDPARNEDPTPSGER